MRIGMAICRSTLLWCFAALFSLPSLAQTVTVSPTSISFGNQVQGTASSVHKVTLKNGQSTAITFTSATSNLSDYAVTNNCPVSPATLAAGASCTISVTFTPGALGTRNATLTVKDSGASSPQLVTLTGNGTAPSLVSIAVTPASPSIAVGNTQQFTATGTYNNGTTQNLTTTVTWSSSKTSVATIKGTSGLATGVAAGSATITAKSGSISGSTTLTVTAVVLTSISVTPQNPSVVAGLTQQFTATGTYSNGTTQNLTTTATWTSSNTSVATITSNTGLATAIASGTSTVTAKSGTISGSTTLTVTAPTLVSISVTPNPASVAAGLTQQFTATGTYSNGTTQNLTSTATWTSSAPSVATVNSGGLATSVAKGTANITATSGTISNFAALTVTPAVLTSLSITPANVSIAKGTSQQFTATGTYSDGSTQNLTSSVNWSSSATAVATIATTGLANGVGVGAATITATSGAVSNSTTLNVGQPTLVSLSVTPVNPSFALGTTQALTATGTYTDGSTLDLTATVTWTTTDASIATVSAQGVAASVALGSTTAKATSGAVTGSTTLTITPAVLVSIAVTPAIPTIPLGTTAQFTATGTYTDGSTQNITDTVQWSSDAPAVATISNDATTQGLASSFGQGNATITATSGSVTGSTTLTVTSAALVSLTVTPATPSIALGTTQQFIATGTFTDGSTKDLTSTATWSSDTTSTATINTAGLAQSKGIGTTSVTASSGTVSSSTTLTVTTAALVSIAIAPPTSTIPLGTMQQFTATGTFTDGTTQDLTQTGHWSSTVAGVATISNTESTAGLASTVGTGTTTIGVSSGSVSATATLVVNPAVLASIAITPQNPTLALGTTQQFTATGTYTDGTVQDLTSVATWSSSDATVAIISNAIGSYGLATSSGQGATTITATSNSISSSTSITVGSPALVSIAITPASASIPLGTSQQFNATGTYTDGSEQDITTSVTWASSSPTVAPISAAGLVTGSLPGSSNISAASGSVTVSTEVTVSAPILVSLSVTPVSPSIAKGTTQQFAATGTYSDGSTQNLTTAVNWSSSATSIATIANGGLASGTGVGSATIIAATGALTASATLTVGQATLTSLAVTPSSIAVASGYAVQFTATATYSDGSTQDITQSASWSSSVTAVATVNTSGLASGLMQGTTNISATYMSTSASGVLTVIAPALVSITVTPGSSLVTTGNSVQLTATGQYSDGSTQNVTSSALWSASPSGIATVNAGLLTGTSVGTVTVTASAGGITSSGVTVLVGAPADFYVATNGNDSWSGTLFAPNSTNTDGPFATIGKAQSAVQTLLKNPQGRTNAVTVLVRGGSYYGQSLAFSSADSGTSTLAVVWQNYPNEVPIISGGIPLTGWLNTAGNAYQLSLPGNTLYFENLFYNGQRRLRPRTGGYLGTYGRVSASVFMIASPPPSPAPNPNCSVYVTGKGWECFDRFQANCSDINRSWQNLSPPYPVGDIELVNFEFWTDPKLRIQSIDQSCVVYLTGPTTMTLPGHGFIPNHRYLIENVKDALSQPGQWFLDRSATPWTLTYLANPGENPNSDVVVIPQSAQVLVATNLQYVTFKGLTFQNDNYTVPSGGYASTQQDPNIPAAVACHNCQNVTFDSDTISETSGMGIEFTTTTSTLTTSHNAFQNGALYDIGGTGIRVGKPPATADTDANVPQFTTIQNNLIEGYSRVFPSGVGIIQGSGHDNTYTHNDIYDGYHSGIEVCLPPACAPGKKSSTGSFNNIASFNHIFNLFEGITADGGAIYFSTGGTTFTPSGNQILNNKIHDLTDDSVMDSDGYGGSGIYLDSYTGLVNIQNNLVYRTSGDSVKITSGPQLAGQANTVKNNILAYSRLGGILNNTPYVGTTCPATVPTIFNATSNLFYFDRQSTSTPGYFLQQGCDFTCGASITTLHNWQNNLYWRINGSFDSDAKAFHTQPKPGSSQLCTLGTNTWTFYTFSGWQGLGEDLSSSVNINPGFNAPAYPTDDYSLPNGSPNSFFTVFDPAQAGRTNPVIKPANPSDIPPTFPTQLYNPVSDY